MKTDKELLELAAKAAGIAGEYRFNGYGTGSFVAQSDGCKSGISWNPLTDDGDAFCLAVKLDIDTLHRERVWATVAGAGNQVSELYLDDPLAATRRAIVRAASAIGETL